MIAFSPRARRQLEEITRHHADRGRDLAIDQLVDSVERAGARYLAKRGQFYDAPRPYPTLLRRGWKWTKDGRYWIAFSPAKDGAVIRAIFYESANIPGHL